MYCKWDLEVAKSFLPFLLANASEAPIVGHCQGWVITSARHYDLCDLQLF